MKERLYIAREDAYAWGAVAVQEIMIRKVNRLDPLTLQPLVDVSAGEGFRHLKRLASEYESGVNLFDKEGEALFIAYRNGEIVGVCGLNQDPYANRKEVGRVRRLYVSPHARRLGIGRLLMDCVVAEARKHYKLLVLRTDHPIADAFYRSIGFSANCHSEDDSHFLRL